MLAPLGTDGVVVKSTAGVQGRGAELWAGAERKERLQSELQHWLCWLANAVQPWERCSMSLVHPSSPGLVLKPHFLLPWPH